MNSNHKMSSREGKKHENVTSCSTSPPSVCILWMFQTLKSLTKQVSQLWIGPLRVNNNKDLKNPHFFGPLQWAVTALTKYHYTDLSILFTRWVNHVPSKYVPFTNRYIGTRFPMIQIKRNLTEKNHDWRRRSDCREAEFRRRAFFAWGRRQSDTGRSPAKQMLKQLTLNDYTRRGTLTVYRSSDRHNCAFPHLPCSQTQSWISWLEWWTRAPRGNVTLMHTYKWQPSRRWTECGGPDGGLEF